MLCKVKTTLQHVSRETPETHEGSTTARGRPKGDHRVPNALPRVFTQPSYTGAVIARVAENSKETFRSNAHAMSPPHGTTLITFAMFGCLPCFDFRIAVILYAVTPHPVALYLPSFWVQP